MHYWIVRGFRRSWRICSGVVLEESPCPRGPVYKSVSLDHKDFAFCDVHKFVYCHRAEDTAKNVLLTDVRYYLLIMSASKPLSHSSL